MSQKRILSIQSHVVSGYVGNKSATFPLQLLGCEVDPLHTVTFSNHSGYPVFLGERLSTDSFDQMIKGLEMNGLLLDYSHVLFGYMGQVDILEQSKRLIQRLKHMNPSLIFLLDPVMGDDCKMYVSPEMLPIYRDLCALADFVFPNAFEAELLSGIKITDTPSALHAIQTIHEMGAKTVIVTSGEFTDKASDSLYLIASTQTHSHSCFKFMIQLPKHKCRFTGTGDLFAALVLGYLDSSVPIECCLVEVIERAIGAIQSVLQKTIDNVEKRRARMSERDTPSNAKEKSLRELCIIESKRVIEDPPRPFKAILF